MARTTSLPVAALAHLILVGDAVFLTVEPVKALGGWLLLDELGKLILGFAVWLDNFTQGTFYFKIGWTGQFGSIGEIWLPAFALGFPYASIVARLTRASMLEVIRQDYIRTARAKGLRETVIMVRHALRNALIPVITILGPLVIGIITGGVIVENIFGIPGLGKEFATSILNRDYSIVIGVFTMYAGMVGVANLLVDLTYVVIDPRIRY